MFSFYRLVSRLDRKNGKFCLRIYRRDNERQQSLSCCTGSMYGWIPWHTALLHHATIIFSRHQTKRKKASSTDGSSARPHFTSKWKLRGQFWWHGHIITIYLIEKHSWHSSPLQGMGQWSRPTWSESLCQHREDSIDPESLCSLCSIHVPHRL